MLAKDKISILKTNGERFDNLLATVSSDLIVYFGKSPLIDSGDLIERRMSNGGVDTFRVIDPSFFEGGHGIGAHYQMKVEKLGLVDAKNAIESITYNINGDNARINNHSVDNSTNIVTTSSDISEHIEQLRDALRDAPIEPSALSDALEVVDELESKANEAKPKKAVIAALLNSLPQVANVATIASFILDLLK